MAKYVCTVCGYVYEGETLPADFKCPLCGVGADKFKKIEGEICPERRKSLILKPCSPLSLGLGRGLAD